MSKNIPEVNRLPAIVKKEGKYKVKNLYNLYDMVKYNNRYYIVDTNKKFEKKWIKLPASCVFNGKERDSPSFGAQGCPKLILAGNKKKNGEKVLYISRADKNGVFKWHKLKDVYETKTPLEYYSQFEDIKLKYQEKEFLEKWKKATAELKKHKIFAIQVGWDVKNFIDNAWDNAEEYVQKRVKNSDDVYIDVSFFFFTAFRLYNATKDGNLYIQHNILKKDEEITNKIMKKYFGNRYNLPVKGRSALLIKLLPIK